MMRELLWRAVARTVTIQAVTDWLIARSLRTPYTHITSRAGTTTYMGRWWLFNPYGKDAAGNATAARWSWLPSIRIHWIRRGDDDEHLHDHPWNARTIVLRGWYTEVAQHPTLPGCHVLRCNGRGDTNRLLFGEYHRISMVPAEGVWTLFFTWGYRGTWGFKVDGKKVPWREYLAARKASNQEGA